MAYHVLRSWQHPTDKNKICIEVWCDVQNQVFYYCADKVGEKIFVKV